MVEVVEGEERPGEAGEVSVVSDPLDDDLGIRNGGSGIALVPDHEPKELLGRHLAPPVREHGEGVLHVGRGPHLVVSKTPLEAEQHLIAPHFRSNFSSCAFSSIFRLERRKPRSGC